MHCTDERGKVHALEPRTAKSGIDYGHCSRRTDPPHAKCVHMVAMDTVEILRDTIAAFKAKDAKRTRSSAKAKHHKRPEKPKVASRPKHVVLDSDDSDEDSDAAAASSAGSKRRRNKTNATTSNVTPTKKGRSRHVELSASEDSGSDIST